MRFFKSSIAAFLLVVLFSNTAIAGSFSEAFRRFVLGPEAEAYGIGYENNNNIRLDLVAENCLNCHNGTRATHITTKDANTPYQTRGFQTVNHPVGMSYGYYADRNPREYTSESLLDRTNIRLVDGKVSCISCHRLKADLPEEMIQTQMVWDKKEECTASKELAAGPTTKDLCVACHYGKY